MIDTIEVTTITVGEDGQPDHAVDVWTAEEKGVPVLTIVDAIQLNDTYISEAKEILPFYTVITSIHYTSGGEHLLVMQS